MKMQVISFTMPQKQIEFIQGFNKELETKYGIKIGVSMVIQKIVEILKSKELVSIYDLRAELLKEKFIQKKKGALNTYLNKVEKVEKKLLKRGLMNG